MAIPRDSLARFVHGPGFAWLSISNVDGLFLLLLLSSSFPTLSISFCINCQVSQHGRWWAFAILSVYVYAMPCHAMVIVPLDFVLFVPTLFWNILQIAWNEDQSTLNECHPIRAHSIQQDYLKQLPKINNSAMQIAVHSRCDENINKHLGHVWWIRQQANLPSCATTLFQMGFNLCVPTIFFRVCSMKILFKTWFELKFHKWEDHTHATIPSL